MIKNIKKKYTDKKMIQDVTTVYFIAGLGALLTHVVSNDNIGFAIAFAGVLYGLGCSLRNNKTAIFMMITLAFDFFGVVPYLMIGEGTLHWYDINILYSFLLFIKCLKMKKRSWFGSVFILYYLFMFIACFQSRNIYGQRIASTIGTARTTLIYIGFWPIISLVRNNIITKEDIIDIFERVCKIAIICYITQFILVNLGLEITYLPTKIRWGTRIYINFSFVIIFYLYNLYHLLYEKKKRSGLWLILCLMTVIGIAQSRSSLVYIAIISGIAIFMSLKPSKIFKYGLLAMVIVAGLLANPTSREVILSSLVESSSESEGSMAYRVTEERYYNTMLKGHELWGIGIPNNHASNSIAYSGKTINWEVKKFGEYYLSDLGAYKIRYQFGIIAYILYFVYLGYVCLFTMKFRSKNEMAFVGFFASMYLIINSSLLEILTREPFVFMLIIIFAEVGRRSAFYQPDSLSKQEYAVSVG